MYHQNLKKMRPLCPAGVILTPSSMRQLSMIGKVNAPFKMVQVVVKKNLSKEVIDTLHDKCDELGAKLVFISREYDSSERFMLCFPAGISFEFFPQDKNLIYLL